VASEQVAAESRLKRWPLLRNAWLARVTGCLGLTVALATFGLAATLLVASMPVLLAAKLAPSMLGVAVAMSIVLWLASAVGVAWGWLSLAKSASSLRLKSGSLLMGEDGLTVRRYFSAKFIAWSRVREVTAEPSAHTVIVELQDGSRQVLLVSDPLALVASARRLRDRYAATRKSPRLRVLACDGRPHRDWIERARSATQEQPYREEVVTEELLLDVVEDVTQLPEQRLGATLALARSAPEVVRRVRIAAESTANPELAEALERALDDQLDPKQARRAVVS
jgi:hypothetical protein